MTTQTYKSPGNRYFRPVQIMATALLMLLLTVACGNSKPPVNKKILTLGDSITEGGAWDELFPDLPVRNRGIGGDTTSGVLDRLDQVSRGRPAKVFLKIGTNDLSLGVPEAQIAANVGTIIERIRGASPATEVYVQSVLPRAADYRAPVEGLNQQLREVAQEKGATWIDLYPHFLDEADGSIRDDLANDELHLLGDGYLLWRERIRSYLR